MCVAAPMVTAALQPVCAVYAVWRMEDKVEENLGVWGRRAASILDWQPDALRLVVHACSMHLSRPSSMAALALTAGVKIPYPVCTGEEGRGRVGNCYHELICSGKLTYCLCAQMFRFQQVKGITAPSSLL